MATTLQNCRVVTIPGLPGAPGASGAAGTPGSNAWGSLTASFTMPAQGATGQVQIDNSNWMAIGEPVMIEGLGAFQVTVIAGALVTLLNLQDGAGSYPGNAAPGTIAAPTTRITPTGFSGPIASSFASIKLNGITKAQKALLVPSDGMLVYQIDNTPGLRMYVAGVWKAFTLVADP